MAADDIGITADTTMAAIDLLLAARPESERLHQIVLMILFERTQLLTQLIGQAFSIKKVYWEPAGRSFDLLVEGTLGEKVRIEIKIDGKLTKRQILDQIAGHEATSGLALVYLLIGTSEIAHGERWGRWEPILNGKPRPLLIGTSKLKRAVVASVDADTPLEACELADSYARMLDQLAARTRGYAGRPVDSFDRHDYLGFFDELRTVENFGAGSTVAPVNARGHQFVCCAWTGVETPVGGLYMQFEDSALCLKLNVGTLDRAERRAIRRQATQVALATAARMNVAIAKTRGRTGKHMTLARFTAVTLASADPRDAALLQLLRTAQAFVKTTGEKLKTLTLT